MQSPWLLAWHCDWPCDLLLSGLVASLSFPCREPPELPARSRQTFRIDFKIFVCKRMANESHQLAALASKSLRRHAPIAHSVRLKSCRECTGAARNVGSAPQARFSDLSREKAVSRQSDPWYLSVGLDAIPALQHRRQRAPERSSQRCRSARHVNWVVREDRGDAEGRALCRHQTTDYMCNAIVLPAVAAVNRAAQRFPMTQLHIKQASRTWSRL